MPELKRLSPKRDTSPYRAFDAVLFDIDNVLVDTRHSYLEAIRWTVEIYLTHSNVPFFVSAKKSFEPCILTEKDVAHFKWLGGFNDDWDCCYGLLVYLINLPVKGRNVKDLKKAMNLKAFVDSVKTRPLGVSGVVRKLGRPSQVIIEKISRIFQEVYLGKELFERIERRPAQYWNRRGLIYKEKLIFRIATLKKLKHLGVKLGIATGRPHFEALYALRHFGIQDYFEAVTTMDDVRNAEREMKQSLRKPHPHSLIETAKKLGEGLRFLYVGDLPDDILAASRAKESISIQSVGFPWYSSDPPGALAALKKVKPDFMLKKPSELYRIIQKG